MSVAELNGDKNFKLWTRSGLLSKYSRSIVDLESWSETVHELYIKSRPLMTKQIFFFILELIQY